MGDPHPAGSAWSFEDHGQLGSTALVALAEVTERRFQARGVPLPADSRVERAREIIQRSHDGRRPPKSGDPKTAALIGEAIRDIWDFQLIARTLPKERTPDLAGKLKLMFRGSSDPEKDKSSKPRDIQFELLVAAIFAMASIPTLPAEPDLRFPFGDEEFGLAAKRVRSAGQLAPRITHARKQLERQGLRGLIAVSVDAFLEGVPANGVPGDVGAKFDEGVTRLHRLLPDLATQRSLLGLLAIGRVVGWAFDEEKPRVFHPLIIQGRSFVEEQPEGAVVERLFHRLNDGIGHRIGDVYREIRKMVSES